MKFSGSCVIDRPRAQVTDLFTDKSKLKLHQEGFQKKVLISGIDGQDGAVSTIHLMHRNRPMLLEETVVSNQLPDSFETFVHHEHMDNTIIYRFEAIGDNKTQYSIEGEYIAVRGFMPKLMFLLFPSMFKNQARKWMERFKAAAESA